MLCFPHSPTTTLRLRALHSAPQRQRTEYFQQYRLKNKERLAQKDKEYYETNKEKILAYHRAHPVSPETKRGHNVNNKTDRAQYHKEYRLKNKEKKEAYLRVYYTKRKDELSVYGKNYYEQNKTKFVDYGDKFALKTLEEFKAKLQMPQDIEDALGIGQPDDWYKFTIKDVKKVPELKRVSKFVTIVELAELFYPERKWTHGRFKQTPRDTWTSRERTREYLEFVAEELKITNTEDWYRVSGPQLIRVGAGGFLTVFGRLCDGLQFAFPEVIWDADKFAAKSKKSNQWWLASLVRNNLNTEVQENYLQPNLLGEGRRVEVDVWVPQYGLALEYQGEQHYHNLPHIFGSDSALPIYQLRDHKKEMLWKDNPATTLVQVPYWWDNTFSSLLEVIREKKPEF